MELPINSLYHHGILGMKWGVRRYQTKSGSLTPAGRARYGRGGSHRKPLASINRPDPETVLQRSRLTTTGSKTSANIARNAANISRQSADRKRAKAASKVDVSRMSDQELRDRINRMNMERQYKALVTEDVARGRDNAASVLMTAGEVLAIGASAASIVATIYTIKNKK